VNWPNRNRWIALWQSAGAPQPDSEWYERLTDAYAEPQRHYHNQQHIAECLTEFDQVRHLARQPVAVELALWFHDAVYDPKAADNEERSAALAQRCLAEGRIVGVWADTVNKLVMATKNHEVGTDIDAAVMVDVDLSILGGDEKRFFEYEEQIRREYAWVSDPVFGSKRAKILEGFLAREQIFATEWFRNRYEQSARRNLEASLNMLKRLSKPADPSGL
jgi:predicted metal-dependent HD superfamily phosphohydrolase